MLISDLNYLEVVSEETKVEGGKGYGKVSGFASGNAFADASAVGPTLALIDTYTYVNAFVYSSCHSSGASAYGQSSSSVTAA